MAQKIQLRRDTAANWVAVNPVLAQGEPGYELDTRKEKRGDGVTAWVDLPYGGTNGASAYEIAVANGFVGTEPEWLASLAGTDGAAGAAGPQGPAGVMGADGASAYEVAVANGFIGTEAEWLASLVGADGAAGGTSTGIIHSLSLGAF